MEILVAALHTEIGGIMLKVHAKKSDAVLSLEGQVINGETEILRSAVQAASGDIVLNFANVTAVDAHGLGVLLELREQSLARGAHFELVNVSKRLYTVFEITRLNTVFDISSKVHFLPQFTYSQRVSVAA
jgi:anti-sigma B factor antagonist